jgi:hypothetical protein
MLQTYTTINAKVCFFFSFTKKHMNMLPADVTFAELVVVTLTLLRVGSGDMFPFPSLEYRLPRMK